jgi:YidC/Oxa1 family membrane protein insertase
MAWIVLKMPAGLPIYWVMFNILGILQQLYVNWNSKKNKAENNNPVLAVERAVAPQERAVSSEEASDNNMDQAGRDKGGKSNDGRSRNRKKRKKR